MQKLNQRLTALFAAFLFLASGAASFAQSEDAAITVSDKAPVVIELFSSQACVFCPQADRLFADLVRQNDVIGLACHIDYFDVTKGSLARPFCTTRQNDYMQALRAGPNYTPQIVVNGRIDAVGYKMKEVATALKDQQGKEPVALSIVKTAQPGVFKVVLPALGVTLSQPLHLWMAVYDRPHQITVAEGQNRGQVMEYLNVVSTLVDLGEWDGREGGKIVQPMFKDTNAGFVVLAQDSGPDGIMAAGQYARPAP
ncbi:MAG: DUF1223 domain-containing protein [Rhodospirillales bacterium]|nr:DUF1223 domain-containing protein [Rhodospirillales bacterium]